MTRTSQRPFLDRITTLRGEWWVFAKDEEARLWVLNIAPDERSLVNAFFDLESSEHGSTPELFVRFDVPFEAAPSYGEALLRSLAEQMAATADELGYPWLPPAQRQHPDPCVAFIAACNGLAAELDELEQPVAHVVVVLTPQVIADAAAWVSWLRLATDMADEHVRLVVLDDVRRPVLTELAAARPDARERVVVCTPQLDVGSAIDSVVQSTPPGPDAEFRKHMLALVSAAEAHDTSSARAAAQKALALACNLGWYALAVTVHLVLASVQVAAGHLNAAVAEHRQAQAVLAQMQGQPGHPRMQLTVLLGLASVLTTVQHHAEAAAIYECAATTAAELGDPAMELDCWRMASHCHERLGATALAWEHGQKALEVAYRIESEARQASSLAHLGLALMRLCERRAFTMHARHIEARMVELTGRADWRACVPTSASGSRPAEGST